MLGKGRFSTICLSSLVVAGAIVSGFGLCSVPFTATVSYCTAPDMCIALTAVYNSNYPIFNALKVRFVLISELLIF